MLNIRKRNCLEQAILQLTERLNFMGVRTPFRNLAEMEDEQLEDYACELVDMWGKERVTTVQRELRATGLLS